MSDWCGPRVGVGCVSGSRGTWVEVVSEGRWESGLKDETKEMVKRVYCLIESLALTRRVRCPGHRRAVGRETRPGSETHPFRVYGRSHLLPRGRLLGAPHSCPGVGCHVLGHRWGRLSGCVPGPSSPGVSCRRGRLGSRSRSALPPGRPCPPFAVQPPPPTTPVCVLPYPRVLVSGVSRSSGV